MNTLKRSYSKGASQGEGVNEVGKSGSSKGRSYSDAQMLETDNNSSHIPFIKQADNARLLPRYTAVLNRTADVGVGMEDLDQLQQDLEKLLSTCAVRNRILKSEIESGDKAEDRREYKNKPPLKRRKQDDRTKNRESRNSVRKLKAKHYGLPANNSTNNLPATVDVPEIRNDTSDKFWLSIEPYCADVSKDDIAFLDELIQECSQDVQVKIPEVGDHYAAQWSAEIFAEEQSLGGGGKSGKSKSIDLKKNGLNAMVNLFTNPSTLTALVEDKPSDLGLLKTSTVPHTNICMELVEQGILGLKDLPKNLPPEDEILLEIKKCQQELAAVNEHNVKELNKLRSIVEIDQKRQVVKEELDNVDKQVMDIYSKILLAKQKPANKEKQEEDGVLPKQKPYIEINEVENIIKQQMKLHAVLTEQTVYSVLQ